MSRRFERTASHHLPDSTLQVLLTCPALHKFEVLGVFASCNGTQPTSLITGVTLDTVGYYVEVDIGSTVPFYGRHWQYNGIVLYPGDNFFALCIHLGAVASDWSIQYIDVDLA